MLRLCLLRGTAVASNCNRLTVTQQNKSKLPFNSKLDSTPSLHSQHRTWSEKRDMADEKAKTAALGGDTIFGKIIRGEIPTEFIYKDDKCVAFKDINAVAPHHYLIIPIKPITQVSTAAEEDKELLGHLLLAANKVAEKVDLNKGYRLVINNGPDGGQTVYHLHVHLIGGKQLGWPPC